MKGFTLFAAIVCVLALCADANAGWLFGRHVTRTTTVQRMATTTTTTRTVMTSETATAQGVANIMARLGRIGHFGGHRWYEGVGCASTPSGAYAICCYARSGMATYDYGIARGANGMYYACRRYRP